MDDRGVITCHGPFAGLDRFEARPAIVAALREQGRIVAEKRPYVHAVGHCSRCRTTVEPRLSLQWFVNTGPLARAAGDAVRDGRVRIEPAELAKRYFAWVDNMHDWCISRQLWWGHRIPVWYGPNGETVCVGPDEEAPTGDGLAPGRGRARHVVLLRAVAVLDPRLARRHRGPAPLLPDQRAGHRLRHPLLLGRPDDDVRPVRHGRRRSRSTSSPCTAWCATSTARRCPSRSATWSTRWTGSSGSAPTPPGSRWPAGPTRAATCRSARSGARARATSATSCGTRPGSR